LVTGSWFCNHNVFCAKKKTQTTTTTTMISGAGKSTFISLVERFYDPTSGAVLIDGHDMKDYDLHWLRGKIGLVSQEPTLFDFTVAENIRLGKLTATDEVRKVFRLVAFGLFLTTFLMHRKSLLLPRWLTLTNLSCHSHKGTTQLLEKQDLN
jgi:ABC-type transport system involved in Fe-S cluster assembly fused permease/ATPase subunit